MFTYWCQATIKYEYLIAKKRSACHYHHIRFCLDLFKKLEKHLS